MLFRTSSHQSAYMGLLELVAAPEHAKAICDAYYSEATFFYNYVCKQPVDAGSVTRFGFFGCPIRPLYLCEMEPTTLFEYAYWLLKNPSDIHKGIKAYTYEIEMEKKLNFIDVEQLQEKSQIMDLSDTQYQNAHGYIKKLDSLPDYIRYGSIRNPTPGGTNYAYYYGNIEKYKITKILTITQSHSSPDKEVVVTDQNNKSQVIRPIK